MRGRGNERSVIKTRRRGNEQRLVKQNGSNRRVEIDRRLIVGLRLHLHRRNNSRLATRTARQRRFIEGGALGRRGLHHLAICRTQGSNQRDDEPEE